MDRSPGRPRDARVDAAVLDAAAEVLDEDGYAAISIEDVARRAGVAKATVYRRWPHRRALVRAELARRAGALVAPDSGCTLCDLHESVTLFADLYARLGTETLAQALADAEDATSRAALVSTLVQPAREAVGQTLEHARARGDLDADADLDVTIDALSSLVFARSLFGDPAYDAGQVDALVRTVLRGAARDYRALEEASEAHVVEHVPGDAASASSQTSEAKTTRFSV